jgi:hypothetical protein
VHVHLISHSFTAEIERERVKAMPQPGVECATVQTQFIGTLNFILISN